MITLDDPMPLYRSMDVHGQILQSVPAGEYKVLDVVAAENEQSTWIKIEVKNIKGYILATVVKN